MSDISAISRRTLLGTAAVGAAGLVVSPSPASADSGDPVVDWIDRTALPLRGVDPGLPGDDLASLRALASTAAIVGLGESAHTTHDEFVLKHRVFRDLVSRVGTRTIAWEEAWASGVLIDRYVTEGVGDPVEIVEQTTFNLANAALLDLMRWMRSVNEGRPADRRLRFLGADVLQLREVQFTELEAYVAAVAPERSAELGAQLEPLKMRGGPGQHLGEYQEMDAGRQRELIAHARAVHALIASLPARTAGIDPFTARMHAYTLRGFYEANSRDGDAIDLRERYIVDIIGHWRHRHPAPGPLLYSAANAHVTTRRRVTASIPHPFMDPGLWVRTRSMAGGLLRERYGHAYASLGITFDHGSILAGWQLGRPAPVTIPTPGVPTVDHVLGQARRGDYLLHLRGRRPDPVDRWLGSPGTLRIYSGSYYDPARDTDFFMATDAWGHGFDALLHLATVTPARLP